MPLWYPFFSGVPFVAVGKMRCSAGGIKALTLLGNSAFRTGYLGFSAT